MVETKKAPNQIVRLALILFLVSAIGSGVLGFVNMLTKDRIKEQEEAARAAAGEEMAIAAASPRQQAYNRFRLIRGLLPSSGPDCP